MTDKNLSAEIFKQNPELLNEIKDHLRGIKTAHDDIIKLENRVKYLENEVSNLRS